MAGKKLPELAVTLRDQRIRAGLTQVEAAKAMGYSTPQFISNWERGNARPPEQRLKEITKLYKFRSVSVLIDLMVADYRKFLLAMNDSRAKDI